MDSKSIENAQKELEAAIGKKNVRTEDFIRSSYTHDGTLFFYPLTMPSMVVLPHSTEDVQKIVQIANKYKIPVVASGGRTNSFGAVDANEGIAIDMANMREIIEIDEDNMTFTVQGGAYVHHLQEVLNKRGFCYFSHPDNNAPMTFGSEVSKNSAGAQKAMYGHAAGRVIGLEAVLGNGDVLVTGSSRVIRSTPNFIQSGIPDLTHLFVAAEGAMGVITEVTMRMFPLALKEAGMDIRFPGTMDGIKSLVKWSDEIRRKKLVANLHWVDWLGMYRVERGLVVQGMMDKKDLRDAETFRKENGHVCIVAIETLISDEDLELRKQAVLDITKKHGGEYFGHAMSDAAYFKYRAEDLVKMLFGENTPAVPFWLDCPYGKVPLVYEKWLEVLDECKWPREMSLFEVPSGDESCLMFCWIFPDPHDEKNVEHSKKVIDRLLEVFSDIGGVPYRIGRVWRPYIMDKLDERYLKYIRSVKKMFDPNNIMNPGVSVFE